MMKKNLLFLLVILLSISSISYAQTWTGAINNDWNEPGNWNNNAVPGAGDNVQINIAADIEATLGTPGVALNPINRLRVWANVVVTLDLDLTVTGAATPPQHAVQLSNTGTLNLGNGEDARTFTISTNGGNALWAGNADVTVNVAANSTVNITGAVSYGLRVSAAGAVITNDGTITVTGYGNRGVLVSNGTFNNNGTITVTPTTAATDAAGITGGICNNSGTMNLSSIVGAGTADNPLLVAGGTLNNTGVLNTSCPDGLPQGAILVTSGSLLNSGNLNLLTGNTNRRAVVSGGTITNNACGIIELGGGRVRADATGVFTNDGLVKNTNSNNPLTAGGGTSTNNGFAITPNGAWGGADNGRTSASSPLNFAIDAGGTCANADIGINVAHHWYSDALNTDLVAFNDAAGMLTIGNLGFGPSGTLYSCYDTELTMTLSNIDAGGCLPVELMSFEGIRKEDNVALTWVTASEENNYGFEVERAYKNGAELKWEMIDFVEGNGTTTEVQTYFYDDARAFQGTNYYRLKQLDFDGQFEYSDVISVEFGQGSDVPKMKISPNPVRTQLMLADGIGQVTIFNILGQPVKNIQVTNASHSISLEDLANGQYIIRVQKENGTTAVQQFSKID